AHGLERGPRASQAPSDELVAQRGRIPAAIEHDPFLVATDQRLQPTLQGHRQERHASHGERYVSGVSTSMTVKPSYSSFSVWIATAFAFASISGSAWNSLGHARCRTISIAGLPCMLSTSMITSRR